MFDVTELRWLVKPVVAGLGDRRGRALSAPCLQNFLGHSLFNVCLCSDLVHGVDVLDVVLQIFLRVFEEKEIISEATRIACSASEICLPRYKWW